MVINENVLLAIRQEIISFAESEDEILRRHFKKGIFFMPELAFVYGVGKTIALNSKKVFPGQEVEWKREIKVGEGGPCDLVLDVLNVGRIMIEFKMSDRAESYIDDVKKLKNRSEVRATRLFCALSDVFTKKLPADPRIQLMELEYSSTIRRIGELHQFPTLGDKYTGPIHCVIGLWLVL